MNSGAANLLEWGLGLLVGYNVVILVWSQGGSVEVVRWWWYERGKLERRRPFWTPILLYAVVCRLSVLVLGIIIMRKWVVLGATSD